MLQSQKNCRKVACIMTNNSGQSVFFTFSAFLNTVNWRKKYRSSLHAYVCRLWCQKTTENKFNPLTLTVGMGTSMKHAVPDRIKPSFVIFDIRALQHSERPSTRMSKITHDGLTRSGTGCFIAVPIYGNSGHQWVNVFQPATTR